MVDWSKPIEAVHTDGRVVPITVNPKSPDEMGDVFTTNSPGPESNIWWNTDGSDKVKGSGWSIRNVVEQPAWRTSAEQLDRMDALVVRLSAMSRQGTGDLVAEAKAILADREQPVDPRFEKVRGALTTEWPALADATVRRLISDVLKALDAA